MSPRKAIWSNDTRTEPLTQNKKISSCTTVGGHLTTRARFHKGEHDQLWRSWTWMDMNHPPPLWKWRTWPSSQKPWNIKGQPTVLNSINRTLIQSQPKLGSVRPQIHHVVWIRPDLCPNKSPTNLHKRRSSRVLMPRAFSRRSGRFAVAKPVTVSPHKHLGDRWGE